MDIQNLVHMANRIGEFFQSYPDSHEAKLAIADHIHKFWDPRMRKTLLTQMDSETTKELLGIVREAVGEQREALMPK